MKASAKATPSATASTTTATSKDPAPSATRTLAANPAASDTSSQNGAKTVSQITQTSLCVSVARAAASSERGHATQWIVSAWATGGNLPDTTIRLQATPASGGTPSFSVGCGSADGTSACDLGAVDAKSAPRQLQAELTVPVTASAVKSLTLTVTGSAAQLTKDPQASATMSITAPPSTPSSTASSATGASSTAGAPQGSAPQIPPVQNAAATQNLVNEPAVPQTVTSPLSVGSLPGIPGANPTLSPDGNAGNLFPSLDPTPKTGVAQSSAKEAKEHARSVADTSALPEGDTVINAQLAGLAALALAFVLAITRLSIRRRPAPDKAAAENKPEAAEDQKNPEPDA